MQRKKNRNTLCEPIPRRSIVSFWKRRESKYTKAYWEMAPPEENRKGSIFQDRQESQTSSFQLLCVFSKEFHIKLMNVVLQHSRRTRWFSRHIHSAISNNIGDTHLTLNHKVCHQIVSICCNINVHLQRKREPNFSRIKDCELSYVQY